jgi:hypothetical protein
VWNNIENQGGGNRVNKIFLKVTFFSVLFMMCLPTTVFANSSWQWLTSSPKEWLPVAVSLTLSIEIAGILLFATLNKGLGLKLKMVLLIIGANLASFLLPYISRALQLQIFYDGWGEAWNGAFESGPYYIVLLGYLMLTLLVEVPIVYHFSKKHAKWPRALLVTIVVVNVITTLIVALLERRMFYGEW